MKKMKDQVATPYQPYRNYPTTGSMASGYPVSRPSTNASSTFGHLPSLPRNPLTGFVPPVRIRPGSGLQLSVKALPNGSGFQPTVPRERPVQLHRLSSSDSKALEKLKSPVDPPSSVTHPRRHSTGESLLKARPKQPHLGTIQKEAEALTLPLRPPSSKRKNAEVLPPIQSMQVQGEPLHSLIKEKELALSDEEEETSSESSSDSEDELFSECSEAPPSRPGFESEAEQSGYMLNIPFPDVNKAAPFPATLIQDYAHLDTERFAAGTNASGLSTRVDNIVRAFRIHGPLDKELLRKALNQVAALHPLLNASFQQTQDRLYIQTSSGGDVSISLDSPVIGHEHPDDLIMNARRKIFQLPMKHNLVPTNTEDYQTNDDLAIKVFSVTSITGSDSSDLSKSPASGRAVRKHVSFAPSNHTQSKPVARNSSRASTQPPNLDQPSSTPDVSSQLLLRAKLSSKGLQEHVLVLSFPRIICDFWSSCLFTYQLSDAYSKLEKSSTYRPSLAASRMENRRQTVINAHDKMKTHGSSTRKDAASRLLQKKTLGHHLNSRGGYHPPIPACLHFQQVAQRESQLLLMLSREKLWNFWESMVTAIIRRQRGPNRVKVVPPVRIPTGLGERVTSRLRPQTSRLRPLTASRNRPQTARRGAGFLGDIGASREALAGPKTKFHYLKIEEQVCDSFKQSLPEEYLSCLKEEELLRLMCLGAYVLMLGKCCRGWGVEEGPTKGGVEDASRTIIRDSRVDFTAVATDPAKQRHHFPHDPLQKYKMPGTRVPKPVVSTETSPGAVRHEKRGAITGKLDLGSFLIGVDVSLRHSDPQQSRGLFGPLTNDVGIRVNLDPRESFADLLLSLWRSTLLARKHGHFPFNTIAEEVGLIRGLPIKFSYYYYRDIAQLTNPNEFYFTETAMGVEGQGLARFGSTCYLTPLNGKMDDSCHMELLLWESYEGDHVCGGIRYQPHIIKPELVESFGKELCQLISAIAKDPCKSALKFAQAIHPPFLNAGRTKRYRSYRKPTAGL